MDMQNISNLEIPEGEVRTIHDKGNRLLWGRVHYDTKYKGDTFQQTYSGKNLLNYTTAVRADSGATVTFVDNGFRCTTTSGGYAARINISGLEPSTTYTLSWTLKIEEPCLPQITAFRGTTQSSYYFSIAPTDGTASRSFTTDTNGTAVNFWFYNGKPSAGQTLWTNIQLEKSTSATSYEKFVGGTASPNPDYPQDVQVVTGEQTVTISDGVNSKDFTVDLGSTELAKIGTYQDYIYKSGDDWHIRKAVAKTVFTGSASESWQYVGGDHPRFTLNVNDIALGGGAGSTPVIVSNYFIGTDVNTMYGGLNNSIASHNSVHQIWIRDNSITSDIDFKTWLSTHNTTVYYALATPTDTKITDNTLISQLNAAHQWLTRYGYNATVSGNLPMIIDRTNL